jgi:hypothetical protein
LQVMEPTRTAIMSNHMPPQGAGRDAGAAHGGKLRHQHAAAQYHADLKPYAGHRETFLRESRLAAISECQDIEAPLRERESKRPEPK